MNIPGLLILLIGMVASVEDLIHGHISNWIPVTAFAGWNCLLDGGARLERITQRSRRWICGVRRFPPVLRRRFLRTIYKLGAFVEGRLPIVEKCQAAHYDT